MYLKNFFKLFLFLSILSLFPNESLQLFEEQKSHRLKTLTNKEVKQISQLTDENYFHEVLGRILHPRVVGTVNHEKIKQYIGDELKRNNWKVEYHNFNAQTPNLGKLPFTNIIAHFPANTTRRLVLACHYDSKYYTDINFVGATDSAVPCAMLVHLAKVIGPYIGNGKVGVTLIFFDGEEAFLNWSDTDSLYGARALADKWELERYPNPNSPMTNLNRIDLMMLLDLIGVKNQRFYSWFRETEIWHSYLVRIERLIKGMGLTSDSNNYNFHQKSSFGQIQDDHVPFMLRKVPVLHLIPAEFPEVWHTEGDNYNVLDFPTITSLNKVFQVFVYSYVHGS